MSAGISNEPMRRWLRRLVHWLRAVVLSHRASSGPADPAGFDATALASLYADVSRPQGVDLDELAARLDRLFTLDRSGTDLQAYREGRKPWKRLREEVVPVTALLVGRGRQGRVRFPLSDSPPDAWFQPAGRADWIGVEATGALIRSQRELAKDLPNHVVASGFRALPDQAPQKAFDAARARGRLLHSRRGVERSIAEAVATALERKNHPKYQGQILLVNAPLEALPAHDWSSSLSLPRDRDPAPPFVQIFVQGEGARARPVEIYARTGADGLI